MKVLSPHPPPPSHRTHTPAIHHLPAIHHGVHICSLHPCPLWYVAASYSAIRYSPSLDFMQDNPPLCSARHSTCPTPAAGSGPPFRCILLPSGTPPLRPCPRLRRSILSTHRPPTLPRHRPHLPLPPVPRPPVAHLLARLGPRRSASPVGAPRTLHTSPVRAMPSSSSVARCVRSSARSLSKRTTV